MALQDNGPIASHNGGRVVGDVAVGAGRFVKRVFDIVAAITGLVLLSPIFLIVSVAIKLGSSGPLFIHETLYGYKNRPIRALKFRTMTNCAEANISGVARIGRILRQTGIEGLPMLFSVLGGRISIVGPRPHSRRQDLYEYRLMPLLDGVKPGLTGLAQVIESCEGSRTAEQRIRDDLHYVENWSFFFDIKIILKTLLS
jgi:lipopolysaccharide/colanic/teichoic acid biosynthesis glycosyltransferase